MKKFITVLSLALALFSISTVANAALVDVTWSLPTTYTDNSAISTADQAKIVVNLYMSTSQTGPWGTTIYTSPAGATSATNVTVTATQGTTYWFTATATLNGKTSAYATPASKLFDYLTPSAPTNVIVNFK